MNPHTHRRGYPEIRVVELFITEKQSNEVLNDEEERQKKGEYRTTNHEAYSAYKAFIRVVILGKAWKSSTLLLEKLLEKLYFTLEKLYFTLKRLFAIESSSQLAFRLLLYLRKALLYSRKALLYSKASARN